MDGMKTRLAAFVLTATAALGAAACGGSGGQDKAGGAATPVVLRLANTNGDLDFTPAVEYFASRVNQLSGGHLRVEAVNGWGDSAPDAEQQVVRATSDGGVDLGWVGTRVFDTLGYKRFQALTAPMLVDSYTLEHAVIRSGIPAQMMHGLDGLGVAGLGVLPDGLRKPIGVKKPILRPVDWRGLTFGTLRSNGQVAAIRALGATPVEAQWKDRERRLTSGALNGFETSIWVHQQNPTLVHLAPYVASNVNLWPQMDVLLANPARLRALTAAQRGWLEQAAREAATRSAALAEKEAKALGDSCAAGARFAAASSATLASLEAAFAPAYARLRRDPETNAFIARILKLKRSTGPDAAMAIPASCTGKAPAHAVVKGSVPAFLNGTYRFMLTQADADKVGDTDTGYPSVETIRLKNGRLDGGCFGSAGGTYSVDGERLTFHSIEYDTDLTVRFTVDDRGTLNLTPVPPMDPGDAFTCFYKPWTKIRGAGAAKARRVSLNGTYRYVLTKADARAAVPNAPDLDTYPQLNTWKLENGRYSNPGGLAGIYSLDGNRIIFDVPAFGYDLTFRFSVDGDGNLRLRPVPPMNRGDRFVWSYKLWKKIG